MHSTERTHTQNIISIRPEGSGLYVLGFIAGQQSRDAVHEREQQSLIRKYRMALLKYGQHDDSCAVIYGMGKAEPVERECTCGLTRATYE